MCLILLEDAAPAVNPLYLATASIPEYDFFLLILAAFGDGYLDIAVGTGI